MSDQQAPDVDVVLGAPILQGVLTAIGTTADEPLDADLLALVKLAADSRLVAGLLNTLARASSAHAAFDVAADAHPTACRALQQANIALSKTYSLAPRIVRAIAAMPTAGVERSRELF